MTHKGIPGSVAGGSCYIGNFDNKSTLRSQLHTSPEIYAGLSFMLCMYKIVYVAFLERKAQVDSSFSRVEIIKSIKQNRYIAPSDVRMKAC